MKKNTYKWLGLVALAGLVTTAIWLNPRSTEVAPQEIVIAHESAPVLSKMERKKAARMAKFDQEIEMTKDPALGYVPFERLLKAQEYTHQLIERDKKQRGAIPGINWVNEGPNNVGGRTRAILFDPNDVNNQVVFAGAVSGGLWKNTDITNSASSWTKINDFLDNLTITSLVADPVNPMIFYAATGEAYSAVTPGLGVFKSTDGGTTWNAVPNTTNYKYISEILVRTEAAVSVLYVASKRNYIGVDGPTSVFIGEDGLFRSADGGTTWTQVMPNNDNGSTPGVDDIGLDASGNLWAATGGNVFGHKGGDIYRCTDGTCDVSGDFMQKYDASANSFTDVQRTVMALAPSDANTVYAVAAKEGGKEDIVYLISSINAGTGWTSHAIPYNIDPQTSCVTPVADQHFTNGQGTYDLCMTVHPTNASQVLLGGIDVYRTLNGFATGPTHIGSWTLGTAPCDQVIHADHHTFVYRPGNPNHVAFGNDGGVWFSTTAGDAGNGAPSFAHHVKDYNVSQLYAADISPTSGAAEYLGGLQDNGTQDWDAGMGQMTSEANGGDGSFCHIDQTEAGLQIASYIYNDYAVTTDDWDVPFGYSQVMPIPQTGRFINPTDYDDVNNVLYAASDANEICRVLNVGTTNDLTDKIAIAGAGLGFQQATTFRVDRNAPTTLYVGTAGGEIFKIENANGMTLTSVSISTGLPVGTWISSIDVQLMNSSHMLATVSSYGMHGRIFESTDGGSNWVDIDGNFPEMPVRWGIFSPDNTDHALLATDLGIWSTNDLNGGSTDWTVTNAGLANVRVDMIKYRISDKKMVAATFGRGLYTATITAVPCPPALTVTDNPAVGLYAAANTVESNPGVPIQVTTNATFQAGTSVALNSMFEVVTGAMFEAKIAGCP